MCFRSFYSVGGCWPAQGVLGWWVVGGVSFTWSKQGVSSPNRFDLGVFLTLLTGLLLSLLFFWLLLLVFIGGGVFSLLRVLPLLCSETLSETPGVPLLPSVILFSSLPLSLLFDPDKGESLNIKRSDYSH